MHIIVTYLLGGVGGHDVCATDLCCFMATAWCLADCVGGDAHLCADGWLLRPSDPRLDLMAQVRLRAFLSRASTSQYIQR